MTVRMNDFAAEPEEHVREELEASERVIAAVNDFPLQPGIRAEIA